MSKYEIPQIGFIRNFSLKCSLKISASIFVFVEVLDCLFSFCIEYRSYICISFHVKNYPQWNQAICYYWHFCYQLVAWTLVFNHTTIIFYVESIAFLYQLPSSQQILFQTFAMIDITDIRTLPMFR